MSATYRKRNYEDNVVPKKGITKIVFLQHVSKFMVKDWCNVIFTCRESIC